MLQAKGLSSETSEMDQDAVQQHDRNMTRLHQARQQLHTAEMTSHATIEKLDRQSEQMRGVNQNLHQNQQELSSSNKLLNHMNKWWRG
jgi:uncharacterized protein (DUF3084 family)